MALLRMFTAFCRICRSLLWIQGTVVCKYRSLWRIFTVLLTGGRFCLRAMHVGRRIEGSFADIQGFLADMQGSFADMQGPFPDMQGSFYEYFGHFCGYAGLFRRYIGLFAHTYVGFFCACSGLFDGCLNQNPEIQILKPFENIHQKALYMRKRTP